MYVCASGLVLLSLSVALVTVEAATTQNEINEIGRVLQIEVRAGTAHIAGRTYDVTLILTNTGRQKILSDTDWQIEFSLKGHNLLSKSTINNGLQVKLKQGCTYTISPVPNLPAQNRFKGLTNQKSVTLVITAEGLSVFKYDFYPRFIITAPGKVAQNIASTDDDRLGFVNLAPANNSDADLSRMTGPRRSLTQPDMFDAGRVPASIVIPSPKSIQSPNRMWVDLSTVNRWYIWPSPGVSTNFIDLFIERMSALPNMTASMFEVVSINPGDNTNKIYFHLADAPGRSPDGYTLVVNPRVNGGNESFIHISASSTTGLHNALESLLGVTGLFNIAPALNIQDDARFGKRSVLLDVTKNFIPAPVIKKFIRLMKMYKLNNLVLNLADDYGWRLEMPAEMNFPELTTYASNRCSDKNQCLHPEFGSGADSRSSGSGFYSRAEFEDILEYAFNRTILVTPKINLLGSIRSAKYASHIRYERLKPRNPAEADRLYLMTQGPNIPVDLPRDNCYADGMLDPCHPATQEFMKEVVNGVHTIYKTAQVPFSEFHAGGDETVRYYGEFPSCQKAKVSHSQAMKNMLTNIDTEVRKYNQVKLRVREETVVDPDTKECFLSSGTYNPSNMIVDFWNIMPGNQAEWGLSKDELDYINGPIIPRMTNESLDDALQNFTYKLQMAGKKLPSPPWTKKGLAPWAKAYSCANNGYKVVLGPESFFSLDSAYELDFDEIGNRKKDRFHIINLHRMMTFEPFNYHTNMDTGNDGRRYLPYRLCHIYDCETLTAKQNIVGLQGSIDTEAIREEWALWESILPGFLLFAEKAWREAPFENILKAEEPFSLLNPRSIDARTFWLNQEIRNLTNNLGYKETGRLDAHGFTGRVPRPGAFIQFLLPTTGYPGPYHTIVKVDLPGADIEYRDISAPNPEWRIMFERDLNSGIMMGGYNFTFPESNQRIEIRTRSTDGQRRSIPTLIRGGTKDLWPREIPIEFRQGTCLPIRNASMTDINEVTLTQWNRILNNVPVARSREQQFDIDREGNITQAFVNHRRRFPGDWRPLILAVERVQVLMARGYNMSSLNDSDVVKTIWQVERQMSQTLIDELDGWEAEYQRCKNGLPPTGSGSKKPDTNNRGQGSRQTGTGSGNARGRSGQAPGRNNQQMRGRSNQGVGNRSNQGVGNRSNQGVGNRSNQGVGNRSNQGVGPINRQMQGMGTRQIPGRNQRTGNSNRQMQGRGQGAGMGNRQMGGQQG